MKETVAHIWSDLHGELRKFIIAKVRDSHLAEDILQEVFIKIHLRLHQLKEPDRLTAWVYQICRNQIVDQLKKINPVHIPDPHLAGVDPDDESNLYVSLSNCINSKIAQLSTTDRQAVLLTYFQNYSQKQLAEFLELSYSGTKNRVQRAREKLKQEILNCDHVQADAEGKIIDWNGI